MSSVIVIDRSGDEHVIAVKPGISLMETIRLNGIDDILALCGGCLSCSTCHVTLEQADFERLPAMTADEDDLLDSSPHRAATSRLSCQIFSEDLVEGMRVTIAPED